MNYVLLIVLSIFLLCARAETLIIGTTNDNPPFASIADNNQHYWGFEIDIMMEVCRRIQATCQFKTIVVSQAIELLQRKEVNLILAAIIPPPKGSAYAKGLLFSTPYLPSSAQFIVKSSSNINTIDELAGKKVGVRLGSLFGGTLFRDHILKMFHNHLTVPSFLNMDELMAALLDNEVDADFSNTEPIRYWYVNNSHFFKLIGDPVIIGDGYSIMGKTGDETLFAQIDLALANMKQDGTYKKIYDTYLALK